jgi:DNA-binding IclR family transcriptional regulator
VLRLASALMAEGFVVRDEALCYRLGPSVFAFPGISPDSSIIVDRTRPLVRSLVEQVQETVHVAVRIGHEMVYIDKLEPTRSLRMASQLGAKSPIHSTALGKAVLAYSAASLLESVIASGLEKRTSATITDPVKFRQEISLVRERGYAVDDTENELNVRCVAAPIFSGNEVVAAISISAPAFRLQLEDVPGVAELLKFVSRQISTTLGGTTTSR